MTDFLSVLRFHTEKYPFLRPADAVKLAYQSEFGCEHMLPDPESAFLRLKDEYQSTPQAHSATLFEDIGGGFARANIAALDSAGVSLKTLFNWFSASAANKSGSPEGFENKLKIIEGLALKGQLPFSFNDFKSFLSGYDLKACPPLSHSPEYRARYRPAYRVVKKELCVR